MRIANAELVEIIGKFAASGWDLIDAPSKEWLADTGAEEGWAVLAEAVAQADKECGSCGCAFDPLYKRALELLKTG